MIIGRDENSKRELVKNLKRTWGKGPNGKKKEA